MKTTKLLTQLFGLFVSVYSYSQCDLITVNGSTQSPDGICAPVTFGMEAHYQFLTPVDTSLVQVLFRWNDAANTETLVKGSWNSSLDSIWVEATHVYPPDDECSKVAEAILVYDGDLCESSGYQSQVFATWGTDEENSGHLYIEPEVYYVCEGVDVIDFTFRDNSIFNCNINIESDRPNRLNRWVQFKYNTYEQAGDRIPDVTVKDDSGTVYSMTDNDGDYLDNLYGPIVKLPYPADGPTETSYEVTAPAGGVAGDIFEVTLLNWNICNAYDTTPTNGLPPEDEVWGDNMPIQTTARIEVIAPTPVTVPSLFEYCTGDNIILGATAGTAEIRWYTNEYLETLLYTGADFNPTLSPYYLDPDVPGTYTFWVTTFQGICESAPTQVDLILYQSPNTAMAGPDKTVCYDSITLSGSSPSVGTGTWTSGSSAVIAEINNPITEITNLEFGQNVFTWTIVNGVCSTSDNVTIYSDRQPSPANAGPDQVLCDVNPVTLNATPADSLGQGVWNILTGEGSISDNNAANANFSNPKHGQNKLTWRVSSRYNVCPVTIDTVKIITDFSAGTASTGPDFTLCETNSITIEANDAINNGSGYWSVVSGSGSLSDSSSALTTISGFDYGNTKVTWTLQSKLNICPSSTDTLTFRRDETPGPADAGNDKAFCLITQDTLNGNTPAIGSGQWSVIEQPTTIDPDFSPNITDPKALFSVTLGNEGAYSLEWRLRNGSCVTRDTVTIDFGIPVPQALAGNDTAACGYDFELRGNELTTGLGTWSVLSGPGAVSFSPDNHQPNSVASFIPGYEGEYSIEWRFTSGTCPPTADTVVIDITTAPVPPVLSDLQSCGPDSFLINIPVNHPRDIAYWYTSNTATDYFHKGNTYSSEISSSKIFYIKLKDTVSTCGSDKTPLRVVIDTIPEIPVLTGDTLCGPGTAILSGTPLSPANNIIWYNTPTSVASDTSKTLTIDTLSSSNTYYARSVNTLTGCYSNLDSVQTIVHDLIPAPGVSDLKSCGATSFSISASKSDASNTLFWYASDSTLLSIRDSLTTPYLDSSTVYYVAEYNPITKCLSDLSSIRVIIHTIPALPILSDTSGCGATKFNLIPEGDNNTTTFRWYDAAINGAMLAEADTFATPLLSATQNYWVSAVNTTTGCESDRQQVNIYIYPSPGALDILGPTVVLLDQTDVAFFTLYGQSSSSYTWDIPEEINVEANLNDFVRLGFPTLGTYTMSVYETTTNGCIGDPVYHIVRVAEDSISIDIGDYEMGACTAEDFELRPYLYGGSAPYTYEWTGDTEYLSSTNTLFTTFSPPGTGTYHLYLQVVDVNLKTSTDSVLITVYESPETFISNTDTIACVDESFALNTISTGVEPFTHTWTGPIYRLDNYTIANPRYNAYSIDTVTYYYVLTDANNCRAYDSITIISDEPQAGFNILTDPGCSPLNVAFENTSINATSYNWKFGDYGVSLDTNPDYTFVNTTEEIKYIEVSLEATSPLGCTDNATNYAIVWPNPKADLTALPQTSCNPLNTLLVSTPGNRSYYWSFGDESNDTTISGFNLYHTYRNSGFEDETYTARVITESSLDCRDTAYLDVTVYATPSVDFDIAPEEQTLPDGTYTLTNNTLGDWSYEWDFGDGTTSTKVNPQEITYNEQGYYSITLVASGNHCTDSLTQRVRLNPAIPVATFKGADSGCMPHTVTLVNNSTNATSYFWDFGDGSVSTAQNPSYTYYESGIYKIKLSVTGPGGTSEFSDTTRVFILPNSYFDLAPRYVYVNDEAVHYFNLSDHGDILEWDFGDGETSSENNPTHVYKEEGVYDVTLKVWTDNGCFDLYVMENAVLVEPSGIIEYPNAFRPNSNIPENREFKPGIIDHVDDYHLMIFNRWGELIFESLDQEIGWDGYYDGKIAKQDVYIWKVSGSYSDGKGFVKTGNVTLLY